MSYIRKCKYCKAKISIREMPDGQWVAFEHHTDITHECYEQTSYSKNISLNNEGIEFLINNSIQNKQVLFLRYRDIKKSYSDRNIEPIFLHEIEEEGLNKSILEAFCRLRQNKRHFRVDRILDIRKTNNFFSSNHVPSNTAKMFEELSSYGSHYGNSYKKSYSKRSSNNRGTVKNGCLGIFLLITIITSLYFITDNILYAFLKN